jgi:hypothetical protein
LLPTVCVTEKYTVPLSALPLLLAPTELAPIAINAVPASKPAAAVNNRMDLLMSNPSLVPVALSQRQLAARYPVQRYQWELMPVARAGA